MAEKWRGRYIWVYTRTQDAFVAPALAVHMADEAQLPLRLLDEEFDGGPLDDEFGFEVGGDRGQARNK